jgi:hypothetical protein
VGQAFKDLGQASQNRDKSGELALEFGRIGQGFRAGLTQLRFVQRGFFRVDFRGFRNDAEMFGRIDFAPSGFFSRYDNLPEDKSFGMLGLATPASLATFPRERYTWFPIVRVNV